MKKLLLIDSFALIFRAYYAYPPTLTNNEGVQINAAYGFTALFLDVLKRFKPDYVIAVFDSQKPTIRSTEFATYKANRKAVDNALLAQIPIVAQIMAAFDVPVLSVDGYEADDILGTLVTRYKDADYEKIVVTGDQDIFQLIDEKTKVFLAGKKFSESKLYSAPEVKEKLGIMPIQVPDYKSLAGDASDNIPGVAGIGKKTASDLISQFETLKGVYENLDKISKRASEKLSVNFEIAQKSLELATIVRNVPLSFDLEKARLASVDLNKVTSLFNELRFKSLVNKLEDLKNYVRETNVLTLFGGPEESGASSILSANFNVKKIENISEIKKKLDKSKKVYLHYCIENINASPIHWKIDKVLANLSNDEIFEIKPSMLVEFFKEIIKDEKVLVGENVKNLFHSVLNLGLEFNDFKKLKFEDLGFLSMILSGGSFDHSLESAFSFSKVNYNSDFTAQILNFDDIFKVFEKELSDSKKEKLKNVYELEKSVLDNVLLMEREGIFLDLETINAYEERLTKLKEDIKNEIYRDVGHEFNISSPKQVSDVLFKEKQLAPLSKTKTGAFTTNERVLNKLRGEPVVDNILKYREVEKILSTYLRSLPKYVESNGRVHATFDQLGAVSGRFSSKNPNMQNIPTVSELIDVRSVFRSSDTSKFIAFDYSQQELRILAALSKEEKMISSFNEDRDIHKVTASELFNVPIENVDDTQRSIGKTINFSIVYGISSFGLSDRLGMDVHMATDLIKKFYVNYPRLKEFFDSQKKLLETQGYLETVMGRRRNSGNYATLNHFARAAVERELLNFTIQGTAADLMKEAMSKFDRIIKDYKVNLLLQIHDEFLFEYKDSEANQENFVRDVKEIMQNVYSLGVKYKVDAKSGVKWGEMKKLS